MNDRTQADWLLRRDGPHNLPDDNVVKVSSRLRVTMPAANIQYTGWLAAGWIAIASD